MGHITSLFVRKIINEADHNVDKDALLRSVGIEPDSPIDPSHMVADTEYYAFLERLAAVDGNATTIPLRAGASMRCDDYGAFGLAWKSASGCGALASTSLAKNCSGLWCSASAASAMSCSILDLCNATIYHRP
jgi:hypothetical protein